VAPFPGYIGTTLKVPFEQEGNFLVPQAAQNDQERSGLAVDLNEPTFGDLYGVENPQGSREQHSCGGAGGGASRCLIWHRPNDQAGKGPPSRVLSALGLERGGNRSHE
jgi:hypothetical protein